MESAQKGGVAMVTKTGFDSDRDVAPPPNLGDDLPILYEDDEEG